MNYILNEETNEKKYFTNYLITNCFSTDYLTSKKIEINSRGIKQTIVIYNKVNDFYLTEDKKIKVYLASPV